MLELQRTFSAILHIEMVGVFGVPRPDRISGSQLKAERQSFFERYFSYIVYGIVSTVEKDLIGLHLAAE